MKKKMKRINITRYRDRIDVHTNQFRILARGINEIMDYIEEMAKRIEKIEKTNNSYIEHI